MLNALAIDDEPIALEVIRRLCAKVPFVRLLALCQNPLEAKDQLSTNKVDLLFLDINLPDISGIDLLKGLQERPMVIFTTAYAEHAVQSFEMDAIDYLLKPFSQSRFLKACLKANEHFELRKNAGTSLIAAPSIFIKSGYNQVRLRLQDILYAESNGNYVHFVVVGDRTVSRYSMKEVEELLPRSMFVRIHRSFIVAKHHVTRIDTNSVWIGQTKIPVGLAYLSEVSRIVKK